jgi:hypothetical protein
VPRGKHRCHHVGLTALSVSTRLRQAPP